MCRHAAYFGPPVPVSSLLYDAPHALEHQSHRARELLSGSVAADGFGVAWYPEEADAVAAGPARYTSLLPIWADRSAKSVTARVRSGLVIGHVRNATEAGTTDHANVHPFTHGPYTLAHNGFLADFRARTMRRLRARLSDAQYAALDGTTESETLFRLFLTHTQDGTSLVGALVKTIEAGLAAAREDGTEAQLNLLVSDGRSLVATRIADREPAVSLYVAADTARFPGGHVVASEPLDDDPAWREVPAGSIVVIGPEGLQMHTLTPTTVPDGAQAQGLR